ncbi:MAG TPA: hypothetical protein VNL14_16960 [Candidatus Acidoferrales bacterium]|nr:hypothetical protein [Candidatus Acidoferrales bacterium]
MQAKQVNAFLGDYKLGLLNGGKAADQAATSEYAGKALGWTIATGPFAMILWPVTIAGSAAYTQLVNNRIRQHFSSVELTDALLRPNQIAAGFVYFKLPDDVKRLERLTVIVEPTEETNGGKLAYQFLVPTLELSAKTSSRTAEAENGKR